MRGKNLTSDEKCFLLGNYRRFTIKELSEQLNRSTQCIGRFFINNNMKNKKVHGNLLSETETRVMDLIAQGYSNKEICEKIGYSKTTLPSVINSIFKKLKIRGEKGIRRVRAVLYWQRINKGVNNGTN